MVLEAKKIAYRVIEISPGIGQIAIFRLSGQRQVPVLVDGNTVISDSSRIIRYIEKLHPEPKLIPDDPKEAALVNLFEDWADTTLANAARNSLIKAAIKDSNLINALLPKESPKLVRNLVNTIPTKIIGDLSELFNEGEEINLFNSLKELKTLIESNNFLVGSNISFADIAVAAQLSLLKFPPSAERELIGKGCLGFIDHPELKTLFHWRDQLEKYLMESDPLERSKSIEND